MKKKNSIVTACYNEEENVEESYKEVKSRFDLYGQLKKIVHWL